MAHFQLHAEPSSSSVALIKWASARLARKRQRVKNGASGANGNKVPTEINNARASQNVAINLQNSCLKNTQTKKTQKGRASERSK